MAANTAYRTQSQYQYGTAVPAAKPRRQAQPVSQPREVRKTKRQLQAETRRARAQAIKLMAVASVCFFLIGFQIFSHVQVEELNHEIEAVNTSISVMESENTRLNMNQNANVSLDRVEDYAVNVLGMVKVENYQVNYVNLSEGDSVELSGGKTHESLLQRIQIAMKN